MDEIIINLHKKELEYIIDSLHYSLYILLKSVTKVDDCSKMDDYNLIETCTDKDKLASSLTAKEIEFLRDLDYFKKLDVYLKLRKKLLGF